MKVTAWSFGNGLYSASLLLGSHFNSKATPTIEVLQGVRLKLNGFLCYRFFSLDSLAFSAILRVNGIIHYIAKTIVTILIQLLTKHVTLFDMYFHVSITKII